MSCPELWALHSGEEHYYGHHRSCCCSAPCMLRKVNVKSDVPSLPTKTMLSWWTRLPCKFQSIIMSLCHFEIFILQRSSVVYVCRLQALSWWHCSTSRPSRVSPRILVCQTHLRLYVCLVIPDTGGWVSEMSMPNSSQLCLIWENYLRT